MHAVVVRVKIGDVEIARKGLREQNSAARHAGARLLRWLLDGI